MVSSLHVYLRDTGQMLSVVLQVWFWMTPIMISEDLIPKRFHVLIDWNPMAWVVRAYRDRLLSGAWPHWHDVACWPPIPSPYSSREACFSVT